MSQYKNQERIALEARLNAELRQSRFATRLKNVDDGTPEDTQTLVNQMLDWEKQLGLEIGTVETLIYAYGEDAYQIMDRVQHDTNVFLATIPARIKLTLNPLDQNMPANIIRAFRDTRLTNTEKISCLSNSHKHKLDKNIANNIINQKRNEQKAQYRLLDTASLEELIAVQAYDRAVQYCKDHKLDITDANLTRTDLLPNITSPNRPQLTSNQLNLARKARNNELSAKYNQICGGTASKTVTINNLLAAGVTAEDFQTLANQMHQQMLSVRDNNSKATLPPELCHVIIPGATMKAIDNAAQHKLNSKDYSLRSGQCGTGTRRIFENHTTDKNAKKFYNSFANLQNIPPEISDKGGCRYWL
ncbi:MAG: hypothetical protein J6W96_05565, partial [Alphaproteobacteria bacterium]|nr:hypothetical protein [Alphaproteobacteria bacterium]